MNTFELVRCSINGVRLITKERYCTEVVQLTDKKFLKFVVLFFSKTTTTILITTGIELLRASLAKLQMSWKERQVGAVAFWPLMLFLLYWIWNSSDGKWWWWWPGRAWEILLLLTLRNANYRVHFNKKYESFQKGSSSIVTKATLDLLCTMKLHFNRVNANVPKKHVNALLCPKLEFCEWPVKFEPKVALKSNLILLWKNNQLDKII